MSLWDWLFRRRQREEELDEEVQAHLRMAAQEHAEQGETAEQARASAAREKAVFNSGSMRMVIVASAMLASIGKASTSAYHEVRLRRAG